MRLKPECVRDVLLAMEACSIDECLTYSDLCDRLPQHSKDDVRYTCLKLIEARYIDGLTTKTLSDPSPVVIAITDITYSGHEFLNTIRPDTVWEKTKSAIGKIGGTSLPIILDIAKSIATRLITDQLTH